jgi:hypothetical protein
MAVAETGGAVAAGLGAATITLTGSFIGVPYDGLLLAFIGGLVALLHLPPVVAGASGLLARLFARVAQVVGSAFFGGVLSPVGAASVYEFFPGAAGAAGPNAVKLACAFLLGVVAQVAVPLVLGVTRSWLGKIQRKQDAEGP